MNQTTTNKLPKQLPKVADELPITITFTTTTTKPQRKVTMKRKRSEMTDELPIDELPAKKRRIVSQNDSENEQNSNPAQGEPEIVEAASDNFILEHEMNEDEQEEFYQNRAIEFRKAISVLGGIPARWFAKCIRVPNEFGQLSRKLRDVRKVCVHPDCTKNYEKTLDLKIEKLTVDHIIELQVFSSILAHWKVPDKYGYIQNILTEALNSRFNLQNLCGEHNTQKQHFTINLIQRQDLVVHYSKKEIPELTHGWRQTGVAEDALNAIFQFIMNNWRKFRLSHKEYEVVMHVLYQVRDCYRRMYLNEVSTHFKW